MDPTLAIRISLATSLAVILPTAISGAYGHYNRRTVHLKSAFYLGVSGIFGAFIGGYTATHIPGELLRTIFAIVLLVVTIQMLMYKYPTNTRDRSDNILYYLFWGLVAGFASGLLGIGGGVILVPLMIILLGFTIIEAIGTSTTVIIFTSLGGIASYIFNGWNVTGLPPYSLGYVNLVQFILLAGVSIPLAQLGVFTAHRLPEKQLRYIFIILLFYMAIKMLGVTSWLGISL